MGNRLHNMFKLAYLLDCDKSQPWQPVFFSPICHLQAVCWHLGWCCMATGRVPTVSIICSSSHTYLIATSRSPGSQYFSPICHLQAVCRHLGWCCMATGRVPTVSIVCVRAQPTFKKHRQKIL